MKTKIKPFVSLILLFIIQISFINNGIFFGRYPNLILMSVIYISQKYGKKYGAIAGIIAGLMYDVLLSPNLGIRGLIFLLIAYVIGTLSEYIFEENMKTAILYGFVGIIIYRILLSVIYFFLSYKISLGLIVSEIFSIDSIINIVLLYIIQNLENNNYSVKEILREKGLIKVEK